MKKGILLDVVVVVTVISMCGCEQPLGSRGKECAEMDVQKESFGKMPDGRAVDLYTLTNTHGLRARLTNYGAIVVSLEVPDRRGKLGDIVLGFDTLDEYLAGHPYFGCVVGRYGNRIGKGRFTLNGIEYQLATNNGPNHLHGRSRKLSPPDE